MNGTNAVYVEEMYRAWRADPSSVHVSWASYFGNVEAGLEPGAAFLAPPSLQPGVTPVAGGGQAAVDLMNAVHLVRAYQVRGHEVCTLDPLGLAKTDPVPELDFKAYGFTDADLDKEINFAGVTDMTGILGSTTTISLRNLLAELERVYCSNVGYEYMHINSREQCNWLRERIEAATAEPSKVEREQMLNRMTYAESFEKFLGLKYGSYKRFGLDGAESLIPGMKTMIDRSTELGAKYIVFGMPHRGRLNVLCNVIRKPTEEVFNLFDDVMSDMSDTDGDWAGSGDVKYHLGMSYEREYEDGRRVHLTLAANPSHLEAVNPVVIGKVRAEQDRLGDDGSEAYGVLLHGDAAFAGQGVVYETMHLAKLRKYKTGGTIHIVVNNQVGFTTNPRDGRSSHHCSDVGKSFQVPIFHVNGDDVEAVCRVFKLATEWRAEFKTDCIIDLVGYRRFGHNEGDQPMFTQPRMYSTIKNQPTTLDLYQQALLASGSVTPETVAALQAEADGTLTHAFETRKEFVSKPQEFENLWEQMMHPNHLSPIRTTGVSMDVLKRVGTQLSTIPEGFTPHSTLKRQIVQKGKAIETGEGIDWATAEALAFGSLLLENRDVRLSGQDVQRGTFSHRHAKWHDQKDFDSRYIPLAHLGEDAGSVTFANSSLSEFGVLGFEFGYSTHNPDHLVLWEGQFGDFANGAQVIIDQFVSCSEVKWMRQSGLVMLLPHGHDGGGPEHSSARLERYLQMSDDDEGVVPEMTEEKRTQIQHTNWQVVNITTPANYFHVLRRQVHRNFRKPLIVMSPKSLLRLPACSSTLEDMAEGTKFKRFIPDESAAAANPSGVKRVLLCSGKVYYELAAYREANGRDDVAIGRVEQISPFPFDLVAAEMAKYPGAEVVWVQEEPQNQGGWTYVRPRINTASEYYNDSSVEVGYAGRRSAAATAVGSAAVHKAGQAALLEEAFTL